MRLGWWGWTIGRLGLGFRLVRLLNWSWPGLVFWRWWRWRRSLLWRRLVRGLLWWRRTRGWRRGFVLRLLLRRRAWSLRPAWDNNGARLDSDGERHRDGLLWLGLGRIVLGGDGSLGGSVLVNGSGLGSSVLAGGYGGRSRGSLGRVVAVTSWGRSCGSGVFSVVVVVATSAISVLGLGLGEHFRQMALFGDLIIFESKVYSVIGDINIDAITGHGNAFDY